MDMCYWLYILYCSCLEKWKLWYTRKTLLPITDQRSNCWTVCESSLASCHMSLKIQIRVNGRTSSFGHHDRSRYPPQSPTTRRVRCIRLLANRYKFQGDVFELFAIQTVHVPYIYSHRIKKYSNNTRPLSHGDKSFWLVSSRYFQK